MVQPKMNLQSFKSTLQSLEQRLKALERKPFAGCPCSLVIKEGICKVTYVQTRLPSLFTSPTDDLLFIVDGVLQRFLSFPDLLLGVE